MCAVPLAGKALIPSGCWTPSQFLVQLGNRKAVDDDDAHHDEEHPNDRRQIKPLAVNDDSKDRDQDNSHPSPDRVGDAYRDPLQAQRQVIERRAVAKNDDRARQKPREPFSRFQGCRCCNFRDDCDDK